MRDAIQPSPEIDQAGEPLTPATSSALPPLDDTPLPVPAVSAQPQPTAEPPSLAALSGVTLTVQAIIGGASLPIADLLNVQAGSIIELDRRVGEPVDLAVNGRVIARGELVLVDGAMGLTLTEVFRPER